MGLRVYNTLTRKKEPFETLQPNKVSMYVCGPTVYDEAHVGHAMSSVVFDIIRRYLEYRGYEVHHVMNYTDVDDKIIKRANETDQDPFELAERLIENYVRHLDSLNVLQAQVNPQATQVIDKIIALNESLIGKGYAYPVNGDVYFRVSKFGDYGKLSRRQQEEQQPGARIEVDERKENPLDFALWKSAKPGEPAWESPWGSGRPGWHIECSAMSLHFLGEQIDIHGGGNDLIFPHHENEIAQSESLTGRPFARYWIHNGMLQLAGEKMSKSIGNLITIDQFLQEHPADVFRMIILNSSYRSPLTFNEEVIEQAEKAWKRLLMAVQPPGPAVNSADASPEPLAAALQEQLEATRRGFLQAMDDDFNTAGALGHLFDLVRAINHARDAGAGSVVLEPAQDTLRELAGILGLTLQSPLYEDKPAARFVDLLIEVREALRKEKNWALADSIRDGLSRLGVEVEDGKQGTAWHWK